MNEREQIAAYLRRKAAEYRQQAATTTTEPRPGGRMARRYWGVMAEAYDQAAHDVEQGLDHPDLAVPGA